MCGSMIELIPIIAVSLGGALGASLRYILGIYIPENTIPLSTLLVNVLGIGILAIATFMDTSHAVQLFVGVGACGSFTTFSSFSLETLELWKDEEHEIAFIYAFLNLLLSLCIILIVSVAVS